MLFGVRECLYEGRFYSNFLRAVIFWITVVSIVGLGGSKVHGLYMYICSERNGEFTNRTDMVMPQSFTVTEHRCWQSWSPVRYSRYLRCEWMTETASDEVVHLLFSI